MSNPIPGLSRVAVVPFFNLSTEPSADGHRFAEAYFTELQRTPGFEVVPVGVTDAAMQDHNLNLNSPADALKLAKILDVDAVVVGAITAYDPYYPPRVGLRVAWYSPYEWSFSPGLPTDPRARAPLFPPPIILPTLSDGTCDGPTKPGRRYGRHQDLYDGSPHQGIIPRFQICLLLPNQTRPGNRVPKRSCVGNHRMSSSHGTKRRCPRSHLSTQHVRSCPTPAFSTEPMPHSRLHCGITLN